MSLKDLFSENKNSTAVEPISKKDYETEIESFDYAAAIRLRDERYLITENFDDPYTFARFGSAEKYYEDSITNIYNTYPYDGSLKEKILWEVSSSLIDLYIFENGYPRTTGYANFLTSVATSGEEENFFPPAGEDEYILIKGGPHAGSGDSLYYDEIKKSVVYRKDANIYDLSKNRENNLKIDGTDGNTIEFWLKKDAYVADQEYFEFIFDAHVTGTLCGAGEYGRLSVALATAETFGNDNDQPILVAYGSGSAHINKYLGSSTLTTTSIADGKWHHYAVRIKTSGSNTVFDLFVDGVHNDTATDNQTIDYVSGAIIATVGAQAASFFDDTAEVNRGSRGWSKFSGSLDEVRYWKNWRTSKQIQRYWFDQVGGGTNTDVANTDLGVYYKFNEGIVGKDSIDSNVLDYSGRVSNGSWTGYSTDSRNTGSAILESAKNAIEFKDPIIYSEHPDVITYLANMKGSGSVFDDTNSNSLITYMPQWIIEQNETDKDIKDKNFLWNLLQIIASYFDEASIMLNKLPELSHKKYYSGDANPPPFNKKALESLGFIAPDLFVNSSLLEAYNDRDDKLKFENNLQKIKNTIYQNIYNNLDFINKSKGTIKSFRNLLHCFGIDDRIIKFNIYSQNSEYKLEDNLYFTSKQKKYVNHNEIGNNDASVYQYKTDSNSTSFIEGTSLYDIGMAFTLETNVLFPNRVSEAEYSTVLKGYNNNVANQYPLHKTSSLFGMHAAKDVENDLTWATFVDAADFQVYTVKDDKYSSNAYFVLTSSENSYMPELTSPVFENLYDDQLWTISVTVEPTKYPLANQISGTEGGSADNSYTVRFYGVNYVADYKAQEFLETSTLTPSQGLSFLANNKRVYTGAYRTNFTGSRIEFADTKINSCKAWMASVPTGTIDKHNLKIGNYGTESPTENAFLYQTSINEMNVPQAKTLALLWDFSTVTGSDANGQFSVEDESSGSATDNRFDWFSDIVSRRHTASGSFFNASSTNAVQSLERSTYQPQVPEVLLDSNLTRILSSDDEFFNRNTRPTTYHLSIEKNMFQNISEEMLNMLGSAAYFNNLLGSPVNVYRGEYKELKKAANLFFEKVDNDYDFDKYVDYYKFIDHAITKYIMDLVPASMLSFKDGISTVIENFALGNRNKFASKYTIIKDVSPSAIEAAAAGSGELLSLYNWKYGHAPIPNTSNENNCLWWNERVERSNSVITSGDAGVDADRQTILQIKTNETNAKAPTFVKTSSSGIETYEGSTYLNRRLAKPYRIKSDVQNVVHGGDNQYQNKKIGFWDSIRKRPTPAGGSEGAIITIEPPGSSLNSFDSCDIHDTLELSNLKGKRKYSFSVQSSIDAAAFTDSDKYKGDIVAPFTLYSSSLDDDPSRGNLSDFQANLDITNLHNDSYGPFNDVPMQGPFTEKYVGGRPYRHVFTNFTNDNDPPDSISDRLEGWVLSASSRALDLKNPDTIKSVYFRDTTAKRPVNIANIQQITGAALTDDQYLHPSDVTVIGNYSKPYEIVMTNGRSNNNRFLAESDGDILTASADNIYISGAVEFTLPRRDLTGSNNYIIVNRFSAPGDPATMAEGMLDVEAGEYSVYNALPWRNLNVIQPMHKLLSDHCKQFGYFSDTYNSASYVLADETYPGTSGSVNTGSYYAIDAYTDATASFHKVNRNTRKILRYTDDVGTVVTASRYDNAFVTHVIPQSDMQYAWITESAENTIIGYEQKDLSLGDYASSDIQFVSASDFVVYNEVSDIRTRWGKDKDTFVGDEQEVTPVDFVGLNTAIYDPITASSNTLGYDNSTTTISSYINETDGSGLNGFVMLYPIGTGEQSTLNAINLHRAGPWGGANWKLYRKEAHPIVRHQKNNNIIGYLEYKTVFYDYSSFSTYNTTKVIPGYSIKNFTEPPLTSKYKPLMYKLPDMIDGGIDNVLSSHGNLMSHFTDHTKESETSLQFSKKHLDIVLPYGRSDLQKITYSPYAAFKTYIENNFDKSVVQISLSEAIYPKGLYTYLSGTRKRLNFKNDFWRDEKDDRNILNYDNSTNNSIDIASIWKLDAHTNFINDYINIPFSGGMPTEDGVGELQNCYCLFHYAYSAGGGARSDILPAVNYSRRIKLITDDYTDYDPSGGEKPTSAGFYGHRHTFTTSDMPSFSDLTDGANPARLSASVGDTLWEATSSSGAKPFYDSYDDYAEEGFRKMKDGTILPEFRISEKIDNYLTAGAQLNYNNYNAASFYNLENIAANVKIENGLLSLTGSSIVDPETDVSEFLQRYAFSDFFKYFTLVKTDYDQSETPPQHKLACEALLKFLPYKGFYPSERCTQLGGMFSESLNKSLDGANSNLRTALQPYFAPGVLFNSIKSGIAVDYPVFNNASSLDTAVSLIWGNCITGNFDQRIKIGDLLQPTNKTILDTEVDWDLALDSTASIRAINPKYTFAMSNFLAESMNTFIGTNNYSSITSMPFDTSEGITTKAGTYTMDIVLRNSENITSDADYVEAESNMIQLSPKVFLKSGFPHITSSLQVNTASVTMYDRAITGYNIDPFIYGSSFGLPVSAGSMVEADGTREYRTRGGNPIGTSFDPYTPPYYNGYSRVRLSYTADGNDTTLENILNELTYSYSRMTTFLYPTILNADASVGEDEAWSFAYSTSARQNAMQLSASLFLGDENINNVLYENSIIENGVERTQQIVAFKPRWECPVLDFSNAIPTESYVSGNIAKGMWHQYGEVPVNKGILLDVSNNSGLNLAQLLKINIKQSEYIGKLKNEEKFSEAVVVIPFKYKNDLKETELYNVDAKQQKYILDNLFYKEEDKTNPLAPVRSFEEVSSIVSNQTDRKVSIDESLYKLIKMMRKYVIPPHLDWVHSETMKPYTMFMIEYEIDLNRDDLQNIWQNIEPTFARKALKVVSESNSHILPTDKTDSTYFNKDSFNEKETRWAVFKVKKRAKSNYNSIVSKTSFSNKEYMRQDLAENSNDFLYSYNWPYDFFSLVELAKINSIATINPIYNDTEEEN